ncbi:hypothetical protein ASF72_01780 [Arthrobacter sp. Leaf141]|uniref:hypothetical protein n=1 Tax=Arthrobacter sp. Leaf141 TaxID=1736273 RepID=UPI0006F54328|nr:hypothetical protein [Arthrobacter sp. Leaf141]KQQ96411.1 hypothetical protein ASF72_01780 [Arthrobacter sp. Leaf141]
MTITDSSSLNAPQALGRIRIPFGQGEASIDPVTGAPVQFVAKNAPDRRFLLDPDLVWHSLEHQWGSGHIITDGGAARWNRPDRQEVATNSSVSHFLPSEQLALTVKRNVRKDKFIERYEFTNTGLHTTKVTSVGIQTPFADLYESAQEALQRSVHAHIFTGGAWAWVLAQPMSGTGPLLGLVLEEGELWGYSIESRNRNTSSNARGHIVLQVTDHARNPNAFGGQPALTLEPGQSLVLQWQLGWYGNIDEFLSATKPSVKLSAVSAPINQAITITTNLSVTSRSEALKISPTPEGTEVRSDCPGTFMIEIGGSSRTEIAFHDPLAEVIKRRCAYILDHQRAAYRPGSLAHAFVPVDTATKLAQTTNGWSDWTDGSERIGMALLLQMAVRRGLIDPALDDALEGWAEFAVENLMDSTDAPRRGSQDHHTGARLYDAPWLAQFFLERYLQTEDTTHLHRAERILNRAFALGAQGFLAIHFSGTCVAVADALAVAGALEAAQQLRGQVIESAHYFAARGVQLPPHEVFYEQSIVAPLVCLFSDAYRLTGDHVFLDATRTALPWLLAFGGPQPHTRLYGVAIRHWDGYWFGLRRQWGDVFPHYWSALTAEALLGLPEELLNAGHESLALAILRANMSNYFPDGSATCAFIMPTTVDGVPAHTADPLANDQDWHLAMWLGMIDKFNLSD